MILHLIPGSQAQDHGFGKNQRQQSTSKLSPNLKSMPPSPNLKRKVQEPNHPHRDTAGSETILSPQIPSKRPSGVPSSSISCGVVYRGRSCLVARDGHRTRVLASLVLSFLWGLRSWVCVSVRVCWVYHRASWRRPVCPSRLFAWTMILNDLLSLGHCYSHDTSTRSPRREVEQFFVQNRGSQLYLRHASI